MLLYFLKGSLPWEGIKKKNLDERFNHFKEKKLNISLDYLCQGLQNFIKAFIEYTRNLKFYEKPNYKYLKGLLNNCAKRE